MQTVMPPLSQSSESSSPARALTWEWLVYLALIGVALALRLGGLGDAPMSITEIPQALAAWRAVTPQAPGDALLSSSPLLLLLQAASFTSLGGTEFAARLVIAALGSVLVAAPLLFRRQLGVTVTFLFSLLLAFSPVMLVSARFSSPAVLSAALAIVLLWAAERCLRTRSGAHGVAAVVALAALVLLSEPGGPVLAVVLGAATLITRAWQRTADRRGFAFEDEAPRESAPPAPPAPFPWTLAVSIAALVVFLVATVLMLYPSGLSNIGELLGGTLRGFLQREPLRPAAFPLTTALFYEPFIIGLGLAGAIVQWRRGGLTPSDRFLCAWALAGAVAAALFGGGEPAHALWLVLPVTGLAARLAAEVLRPDSGPRGWDIPYFMRFLAAAVALAVLFIFTFALQAVSRDLTLASGGQLSTAPVDPGSMILLLVGALLMVISAFLGASLLDWRTVLRAAALALLVFGAFTSLGSGWRAAVTAVESPYEFWHPIATDRDSELVSASLDDLDDRQSRGFTLMPLAVMSRQDALSAWLTRAYPNARFVTDPFEARGDAVVVIESNIVPDLGGPYVGQDFTVLRAWPHSALPLTDVLAWWTQGRVSLTALTAEQITTAYLWVRQDVWQGTDDPYR